MLRAYKFRILPSSAQVRQIEDTFSACTYVYNRFLGLQLGRLGHGGQPMPYVECAVMLQELWRTQNWMQTYDLTALRHAVAASVREVHWYARHPDAARPIPQSHNDPRHSFRTTAGDGLVIGDRTVHLPYLGKMPCGAVRRESHRVISAAVIQCLTPAFDLAVCCETEDQSGFPCTFSVGCLDPGDHRRMMSRRADRGSQLSLIKF